MNKTLVFKAFSYIRSISQYSYNIYLYAILPYTIPVIMRSPWTIGSVIISIIFIYLDCGIWPGWTSLRIISVMSGNIKKHDLYIT